MPKERIVTIAALVAFSGSAFAADLPRREAPPAPVYMPPLPVFTWTGFYIGGQIGDQFGTSTTKLFTTPARAFVARPPNYSANGIVGGGHVGYNWQTGPLVFGVEGDAEGTNYKGTGSLAGTTFTTRESFEASARGRVGFAWDHALVYATGGGALANIDNTYKSAMGFDNFSKTRLGWTVGSGIEYALTDNWSIRGEYRYTDFGRHNDALMKSAPGVQASKHETDNAVRAGVSYKFQLFGPPAPVSARY